MTIMKATKAEYTDGTDEDDRPSVMFKRSIDTGLYSVFVRHGDRLLSAHALPDLSAAQEAADSLAAAIVPLSHGIN